MKRIKTALIIPARPKTGRRRTTSPRLLIGGALFILFVIVGLTFVGLFSGLTINGFNTASMRMWPSNGSTSAPGSISMGGTVTIAIGGEQTGQLTGFTLTYWKEGGSVETLEAKTWPSTDKRTNWYKSVARTLTDGKYYLKLALSFTGEVMGAKGATVTFYVGIPPSISVSSPTSGGTIELTVGYQWQKLTMPISFTVTQGSSAVTGVSIKIDDNNPWTGTGTGAQTVDVPITATGYESGITTTHYVYLGVSDAMGRKTSTSRKFYVTWTYTGVKEQKGEFDIPFSPLILLLGSLVVLTYWKRKRTR